jgi:maleate isomerase
MSEQYAHGGMADRLIRIGILTPHAAPGPEAEFPAMAPGRITTRVRRVAADVAGVRVRTSPPAPTEVRRLTEPPLLEVAADSLAAWPADVVGYASTSSAYVIGFDDEEVLIARLSRRMGIPVASTCASAVLALRILEVERVALVAPPWFDGQLNKLGATYFTSQGLHVVSSESAELPRDPRRIEPSAVYEWTSRHVPDDADAVFIGGNGFRAAGAIEALEARLERSVLTSNQVLLWNLLTQSGADFQVGGYGRLFTHTPPPGDRFD